MRIEKPGDTTASPQRHYPNTISLYRFDTFTELQTDYCVGHCGIKGVVMGFWFSAHRSRQNNQSISEESVTRAVYELRLNSSAIIAAAIISASGRPHSVNEALRVVHDVRLAMEPKRSDPEYVSWVSRFDGSKAHV